jgi:hypothetical protein
MKSETTRLAAQVADTGRAQFCGMRRTPDLPEQYVRSAILQSVAAMQPIRDRRETFETVEYATDPPYAHLLIVAGMLGAVLVLLFMAIVLAVG